MKKIILSLCVIVMTVGMSVSFVSCDDDEEDNGIILDPQPDNDGDDEAMYEIVGKWKGSICPPSSAYTQTVNLEVRVDGSLIYKVTWDRPGSTPSEGRGTWEYNKSTKMWYFSTWSSSVSGDYKIIHGQLVYYAPQGSECNIIFDRTGY